MALRLFANLSHKRRPEEILDLIRQFKAGMESWQSFKDFHPEDGEDKTIT